MAPLADHSGVRRHSGVPATLRPLLLSPLPLRFAAGNTLPCKHDRQEMCTGVLVVHPLHPRGLPLQGDVVANSGIGK